MKKVLAALLAVVMVLGTVAAAAGNYTNISVVPGMKLIVNGEEVTPTLTDGSDAQLFAYEGTTYAPVRFIAELCGLTMDWDAANPTDAILNGGEKLFTPGGYTATAIGMDGEITIRAAFSDNAIIDITVLEDNETASVGDKALELIAQQVLEGQTLAVDMVAGATVSSAAMLAAVTDAVKQAGGDVTALKANAPAKEHATASYDYDVVVVGSGIAGLSTALKAATDGAKVALIEKLGIVGGTSIFSSGAFMTTDSVDAIPATVNTWIAKNLIQDRNPLDADRVGKLLSVSPELVPMIMSTGVNASMLYGLYFFPVASAKAAKNASTIQLASATPTKKGGQNLIDCLKDAFVELGGDIYVNTPGTSLILDDTGAVTGVKSETKDHTLTFNAKGGVVLATGDYARNAELTAELAPQASGNYTAASVGCTGDGHLMALEAGAVLDHFQESMSGIFCPDPYNMPVVGQPSNSYPYSCLLVDVNGERKISETAGTHDQMVYFVVNDGTPDRGWVVMDQEIAGSYLHLEEYLDKTSKNHPYIKAYQADTIEELAEKMGVAPKTLTATVDHYNELCAAGEDTDFGKAADYLSAIDEGPFYAVTEYNMTRGNYGGILTNADAAVIKADGSAIPGLYAAGIISSGEFFGDYYSGGQALAVGAHMGFIAGRSAAAAAK